MKQLTDLYINNADAYTQLMNCNNINVSVKLDGIEIQILCDDDKIEYRKYSGSDVTLGNKITDMDILFVKQYNDAIKILDTKIELLKKYKFLNCEIFNNDLYLISCIDKKGTLIKDVSKLRDIAEELEINIKPILFTGKLSKEQILLLTELISDNDNKTVEEFKEIINNIFTCEDIIEDIINFKGLVFEFHLKNKTAKYKLLTIDYINNKLSKRIKLGNINKANKESLNELARIFVNYLDENAKKLDDNYIKSLEKNFINTINDSKTFNKLLNISAQFIGDNFSQIELQVDRTSEEMQKLIKKYGDLFKLLYSKFLYIFYKPKKRFFIINKTFQEEHINNIIERMK